MITSPVGRRIALALAFTFALGFVATAPAAASPLFANGWYTAPAHLWAQAWGWVNHTWTQESGSSCPAGRPTANEDEATPPDDETKEGGSISPAGRPAVSEDESTPPDGHTEDGSSIEPAG